MGLDITVRIPVSEVRDALQYDDCGVKCREVALKLLDGWGWEPDDTISTRPGSYAGLHRVRKAYIDLKGLPPTLETGIPEEHRAVHLLNHSDCEGWYLPDDFEEVFWYDGGTVGSSVKLLAELEELESSRPTNDLTWGSAWDAVYIAAVASVVCSEPMHFH